MKRLGQNRALYRLILIEFRQEYAGAVSQLRRFVKDNNREDAIRYAHTIKGMAGNLSASGLYEASLDIEMAFRESAVEDFAPFIDRFRGALDQFLSSASRAEALLATEPEDHTRDQPGQDMQAGRNDRDK